VFVNGHQEVGANGLPSVTAGRAAAAYFAAIDHTANSMIFR
jgi:hypothetical protein